MKISKLIIYKTIVFTACNSQNFMPNKFKTLKKELSTSFEENELEKFILKNKAKVEKKNPYFFINSYNFLMLYKSP